MATATPSRTVRLAAAEKTSQIVNRQHELELIRQAIFESGSSLRVVLIRGPRGAEDRREPEGGFGKTRLLEEVSKRTASGGVWQSGGEVAVSQLIDLIDTRLHAQSHFLREARDAFLGRANFIAYDDAYNRYLRRLSRGAEYHAIREAAEKAEQSFLIDYRKNAQTQRLVWLLDTVEQLAVNSSAWLLERGLLKPDDMKARTVEWLRRQIENDALPNTTLICAGRGREGRWFFEMIKQAVQQAPGAAAVVEVYAEPFSVTDTRRFFHVLADDLRERARREQSDAQSSYVQAVKSLDELAQSESERARVAQLYTGGVPVRLALYAQLLVGGRTIPEQLQWSWPKVIEEVKTESSAIPTPELEFAQWQIEDQFITLLFNPRETTDPRFRILQTLVRARHGLTAEQLHFVLDNPERKSPQEWEDLLERRRIGELEEQLKDMATLFLVKRRSPWWQMWDDAEGPTPGAQRHGLQDEIYRIYAEHMALSVEPRDERLQRIWDRLKPAERERYKINRETEKKARERLYTQLRDWARYQQDKLRDQRRKYQEEDERSLRVTNPAEVRQIGFPTLSDTARSLRLAVSAAEQDLEIERMHYEILLDPQLGINTIYTDVVDNKAWANDETTDLLAQTEMSRVLMDDEALKFVNIETRPPIDARGETPLYVLRRAVQQEDVTRWIRRFVFRKDYQRVVEFTAEVEQAVGRLQQTNRYDWESWNHSMTQGERLCWSNYAQILASQNIAEAIGALKDVAVRLESLANHTVEEEAIPPERSLAGKSEKGFCGVEAKAIPPHPGYVRAKRVLSATYNALGYGYVNVGRLRDAIACYSKALYYIRETGARAHRANVLNNLSRALSDMGRERAVRVCRDGLNLRLEQGADVPIAYSHNTLALIYNDRNRPEDAWPEAAKAVAYFRRAEEPRGLGLALLQLGEALRRMAGQARFGRVLPADPDSIYAAAEDVLNEAHSLFSPPDPEAPGYSLQINLNEPLRLIEAKIEMGCLFRDRLQVAAGDKLTHMRSLHYREAQNYLKDAIALAQRYSLKRHEIDAHINLAWAHYYAGQVQEAADALNAIETQLQTTNRDCCIRAESPAEPAGFAPNPREQNEFFVFSQLSKIYNLRGIMAFERFRRRADEIEQQLPGEAQRQLRQQRVHQDTVAQNSLQQAAECYTLGTAYAQLYSPRSSALSMLYDRLYDYLKGFNGTELDDFQGYIVAQRQRYPLEQVKANIEDLGNIEQFMFEVFGLSLTKPTAGGVYEP